MKKIIAVICLAALVLPLLFSCGGGTTDIATGPATPDTPSDTSDGPAGAQPALISIGGFSLDLFGIVLPDDPSAELSSAATDMAKLIYDGLGVSLPVTGCGDRLEHSIILGQTAADTDAVKAARARVENDGYAALECGGDLYITGATDGGTVNGIYDVLEDFFGMRFCTGTYTVVRDEYKNDIPSGFERVFNPVFTERSNYNSLIILNVNGYAKKMRNGGPDQTAGSVHNLGPLSGKSGPTGAQPCLSDPEVFDKVFQGVCGIIEKKPGANLINVQQNDSDDYCKCSKCAAKDEAAGSHMGALLMFINDIAAKVKETYPDRDIKILTLAYAYSADAPDPDVVKPADNVAIRLCMMNSTCFTHAFNDPDCEMNRVSYANLLKWSQICDNLYIWDYSHNSAYEMASNGPDINVLWDNMQAFAQCGVKGQFQSGCACETGEFWELRSYLISHLLWDPYMSREEFETMRDDFMRDYYGDAAPFVYEYIVTVNDTTRIKGLTAWDGHTSVCTDRTVFYAPSVGGKPNYTVVDKCSDLWEKALSLTLDDEIFCHVEKSSLHYRAAESSYAHDRMVRKNANLTLRALCDKYTFDYDESLPARGETEGFSLETPSEGIEFRQYPDGTLYVSDVGSFSGGVLVIPEEKDGVKVSAVGNYAFSRACSVVEAVVPEGVERLGDCAFRGCSNLERIHLPSSLKTIGYGALGISGNSYFCCELLKDVYYGGSTADWEALYAENNAEHGALKDCTVHCADGDITY